MVNEIIDPMEAIKQTFFQECEEQLAELESGLLAIQAGDSDPETVNAVFRAVHSIKGGAGAFALEALVRFAHVFETALDKMRSSRTTPEPVAIMVMLRAADALADLVRATRDDKPLEQVRSAASRVELAALIARTSDSTNVAAELAPAVDLEGMDGIDFAPIRFQPSELTDSNAIPLRPSSEAGGSRWTIHFRPHASMYAKANDTALLLRELSRLGSITVTLDRSELPGLPDLDPEGAYLAWTVLLLSDEPEVSIHEVFEFVDGDCTLDIRPTSPASPTPSSATAEENGLLDLIRQATAPVVLAAADVASRAPVTVKNAAPAPILAVPVDPVAAPATGRREDAALAAKPTIRVDLGRVDRLIDLVGELVINQAMLAQAVLESGLSRSSKVVTGLDELEQLTRGIQDSVMAIRAQPVKSVFQRMPRLARELALLTEKQIRLVTEGEGTEVDKTVIEHLSDPLTHMIRNAIDHGVERPEVRLAAGKPAEGTVRLAALHRSGRIVIEISDDGAGINRPRVRASAIEKGLISNDAVLSDEEIDNLIFMPGFSTAATVSDISGRGVGMDVVRRSIQALGGRISIASRPGYGSTFTMSLPLTLAVLDGMVVTVEDQTLVVPLTTIIETLQPRTSDIFGFGGAAMVIAIRGSYTPLIDVGLSLGYRQHRTQGGNCVALLIEGEGGVRAALLVDAIQGQRQVVIKSLETNYRHVPGIAAATILGDGRVALILDIDAISAGVRMEGAFNEGGLAHA